MHKATLSMGSILMKTMDYFGWTTIANDQMLNRFVKENFDMSKEDIEPMQNIIDLYIPERNVAVEIGCHYGFFTKFLSTQFKTVHAFDFPNDIYECFEKNMDKFKCDNVARHPYGIGETEKPVATNDWFTKYGRRAPLGNHIDVRPNATKKYKIKTLDSLKLDKVNLIMVDTEGYELNVIRGAAQTILKHKPVLVLEFHNKRLSTKYGNNLADLERRVIKMGYVFVGFVNKHDRVFVSEAKA